MLSWGLTLECIEGFVLGEVRVEDDNQQAGALNKQNPNPP